MSTSRTSPTKSPARSRAAPAAVTDPDAPRPRPRRAVRAEGADDLYSQNWYPICRSDELPVGRVLGRPFLGGKVAVYRTSAGEAQVVGGYCVHMGADLGFAAVEGEDLVCPFHQWRFAKGGRCVATGVGDPPPPRASLFAYPTTERWGMVFAFNGVAPLYPLPALQRPEETLLWRHRPVAITECDAFMLTANTFDWSHFGLLHDFHAEPGAPEPVVAWGPHQCGFTFEGRHWLGERVVYALTIAGTNIYMQQGTIELHDGPRWYAMLLPIAQHGPGKSDPTMILATERGDGSPEALRQADYLLDRLEQMEMRFVEQDKLILNNIHFGPGYRTPADGPFFAFLDYLDRFPRANPGLHYLR